MWFCTTRCTTRYESVVGDTVLYYKMRFCTTRCDSVLRDTILHFEMRFCITRYDSVLRDTIQSYEIRFCTTRYNSVLRDTILYYEIQFCTTRCDSILRAGEIAFPISKLNARAGKPGITKNHKEHQWAPTPVKLNFAFLKRAPALVQPQVEEKKNDCPRW